ncbi:1-deoxy-D-xylulose 5-phosphate reductoisomerase [Rickettsiales bacterium Ac37b]|nr:1-deoxy-D-xylulose 5-phosphate reductoisomerase [Rickettsiales bacterium Ac37b]
MVKKISILGSTGSIGKNSVKLIYSQLEKFEVQALTSNQNVELLVKQALQLQAKLAVIADETLYNKLKLALEGTNIKVAAGISGLLEAACMENDLVISAIVGIAGLKPTMAAIEKGSNIALANKECLVCAGDIMTSYARAKQVQIIPVDSEHSAIFQLLGQDNINIEKIILTASGGPFRLYTQEQMLSITQEDALNHPTWQMGKKNTIDSATLINKGLELIEAHYLFNIEENKLDVIIHPESIIHSMIEFIDGAMFAQLSTPDMCIPISYALNWPSRGESQAQKIDFNTINKLTFERVNYNKFPGLKIAQEVLKAKGSLPVIMNVSNEVAVEAFINGQINFIDIVPLINESLCKLSSLTSPATIEDILEIEEITRNAVQAMIINRDNNVKAA